ncbi:MAG: hypothetical protein HUJ31_01330, partial [Pseudomonadales bacterium]|nr:hypothetical protein [Pseudomonadales bacterium]
PASMTTDANTATVTLGSLADYKDHFFDEMLGDDKLIFHGSSSTDRIKVHGVNPYALEEGIMSEITVTATVANGDTASATATIEGPHLPYDIAPGIPTVPVDRVVVMHGPNSWAAWNWTFTQVPVASGLTNASIGDGGTQHPYFTPDVEGTYTLNVSDGAGTSETFDVVAGTWTGVITGISADGKPDSESCAGANGCHNGSLAADKFTPWRESGHAHILSENLNTSTYYGTGCFMCHTVGYDPDAVNGGIDEASDFDAWLDSGLFTVPNAENWATTVSDYPASAKLANIQCENCHGPQDSVNHMTSRDDGDQDLSARISLNADMCATCHGEPLRHARFQQWQEAGHSNAGLAAAYGGRSAARGGGHCGRCHTGQGFLHWIGQNVTSLGEGDYIDLSAYLTGDDPSEDPSDPAYDVTAYQAFLDE